jgi:hypothetical protein
MAFRIRYNARKHWQQPSLSPVKKTEIDEKAVYVPVPISNSSDSDSDSDSDSESESESESDVNVNVKVDVFESYRSTSNLSPISVEKFEPSSSPRSNTYLIGPTGPSGQHGERGSQGPTGDPGEGGPRGKVGPDGLPGVRGFTGSGGEQGPVGECVCTVEPGPTGEQGPTGPTGECTCTTGPGYTGPGVTGPIGEQGLVGPKGLNGPKGATGPVGEQGFKGPKGATGVAVKSILYNNGVVLTNESYSNIVTIPFNGSIYVLDNCSVVLNSATGVSELILINITDPDDEVVVGKVEVFPSGLQVVEWKDFDDLPGGMSILQMRGKAESKTQVMAIEFNMS